ncbi:contractile injection system protein, VgrG/Pvc8 family [Marinomonas aquiplantarum]|uniref:Late control gene D protein (GPD) n=1 Tax=Marinomonas aquiplantarum TaxID=491951 RepID=A0A366CVP7_9GAMM|nr:contractile injection system protein, VgrG/Pvc8 family [Marinomonas aquiplantarum]RBO81911.1 late control gene D protein (GPD) [Marinomonas aquiplantarum]
MSDKILPLDYMAVTPTRQFLTNLSFAVKAGGAGQLMNANYLRLISLQGQEAVSQPYHFSLSLRADETEPYTLKAASDSHFSTLPPASPARPKLPIVQGVAENLIGQWTRVTLGYTPVFDPLEIEDEKLLTVAPAGVEQLPSRYFYGLITSMSLSAPGEYTAEMQSPLFPLTLRNKYDIYKGKKITEVIEALVKPELERYGDQFKVDTSNIKGLAASREQDWLQSGETDFAMLQRLMKKAAIYFYFIHGQDGLTLVFSNQTSKPDNVNIPGCRKSHLSLRYSYTDIKSLGLQQSDLFCNLQYQVTMVPDHLETALVYRQPNWRTNQVAGYDSYIAATTEEAGKVDYSYYQAFSYGVDETESKEWLSNMDSQFACQQSSLSGECTSTLLSPGYAFYLHQMVPDMTLTRLMPEQFNDACFTVTKVTHKVSQSAPYSASIEATPIPYLIEEKGIEEKGIEEKKGKNAQHEKAQNKTFFDPNSASPNVESTVRAIDAKAVLITPFDLQETHQGSVLARVLESAVPKSAYFFEKGNFDPQLSKVSFGGAEGVPVTKYKEMGCVVQFATDEGSSIKHWVALSDSSETAPAVNSMVVVARGDNESEIPQIQQSLSSHGQKCIQPALWKSNSWNFNTNWGSSCNTSYGDSLSIHFGEEVTPDLDAAMKIVKEAYINSSVLEANIGGANYNKGTSFSYSTTEKGAQGLASASVSKGCHFSESNSEQDYSVSYNNTRQSYSQSNKSVNVSSQGPFVESIDETDLSFINGKIPNKDIIDICDDLPDGSSLNQSHVVGKSINLSGTGTAPPSVDSYDQSAVVYSHSKTEGKVVNKNEHTGDTTTSSTTTGNNTSTTTMNGDTTNISTTTGNTTNTTIITGDSSNTSTTNGNSTSHTEVTGNSDTYSKTIGKTRQNDIFVGAKNTLMTNVAATNTVNTFVGASNDVNSKLSLSNSVNTTIGASNSLSANLSANTSISATMGIDLSVSTRGGLFVSVDNNAGVKIQLATGNAVIQKREEVAAKQEGLVAKMVTLATIL